MDGPALHRSYIGARSFACCGGRLSKDTASPLPCSICEPLNIDTRVFHDLLDANRCSSMRCFIFYLRVYSWEGRHGLQQAASCYGAQLGN